MNTQSQTARIHEYMKKGNTITPLEALDKFGCFRLSERIREIEKYDHIRLLWDYHADTPEAVWEMRIEKSDLTGNLSLLITDYAADDEEEADLR